MFNFREKSDTFAARSHRLASEAQSNGWFDWEMFSVDVLQRRGASITFSQDEGVRPETDVSSLSNLRPVFQKDGQVTAGNASTLNDGASAVLIANAEFAEQQGWNIYGYIEDYCTSGVEPERVMSAPIPAVQMLLQRKAIGRSRCRYLRT